jgi:O-antigen ligase
LIFSAGHISNKVLWLSFGLLLLMVRLEEQLYLVAAAVGCLLTAAVVVSRTNESPEVFRYPSGKIGVFATLHVSWLLALSFYGSMPFVSYWIAWIIGLMPIGYLIGRQVSQTQQLWLGLAAINLVIATWVSIQYLGGAERASGPFLDWNSCGAVLYVFLLPAFVVHCDPRRSAVLRKLCLAGITIGLFALFATYSRGAIAVMLLMSIAVFVCLKHSGVSIAKPLVRISGIALLCYLAVKLYPAHTLTRTLDVAHDPSMLFRLMMWKSAWTAWLDHPWLGTGIGTYRLQYLRYRLPTETDTSGDLAHNDYLQMLMEGGPVLLGFLLAWGLVALWLSIRLWQLSGTRAKAPEQRLNAAFALSLTLAVLGLFAHAGINFIFYVAPLSFIAGLYLAQAHLVVGVAEPRRFQPASGQRLISIGLGLGITLIVGSLLADWAASELLTPGPRESALIRRYSVADKPLPERYRMAASFEAVRPNNVIVQQTLAVTAADIAIGHHDEPLGRPWAQFAIEHSKRWLEVSHGNPLAYITLARVAWSFPDLQSELAPQPSQPDSLLRLAIENYPALPDGYRLLSGYLRSRGQSTEALTALWSALRWARIPVMNESVSTSWDALIAEGRELGAALKASRSTPEIESMAADFEHFSRNIATKTAASEPAVMTSTP